MGLLSFEMKNWHELDNGRLAAAVELALKKIVADCQDRPGLDAVRKLTIELKFSPEVDHLNDLIAIDLEFAVKTATPPLARKGLGLGVKKNGRVEFSTVAPENAAQTDLLGDE